MSGPSRSFSARLSADVVARLEARTDNKSARAERYIDEGMRMEDHPGIVFRDGPAGRRAALAVGPDVWEVISVLKSGDDSGAAAIAGTAEYLQLDASQVRAAVGYYAVFQDEIDNWIARNRQEAEAAEAAWQREQALLS